MRPGCRRNRRYRLFEFWLLQFPVVDCRLLHQTVEMECLHSFDSSLDSLTRHKIIPNWNSVRLIVALRKLSARSLVDVLIIRLNSGTGKITQWIQDPTLDAWRSHTIVSLSGVTGKTSADCGRRFFVVAKNNLVGMPKLELSL